jgi:hypothetical protein
MFQGPLHRWLVGPYRGLSGGPGAGGNPLGQFIGDSAPSVKDKVSEIVINQRADFYLLSKEAERGQVSGI